DTSDALYGKIPEEPGLSTYFEKDDPVLFDDVATMFTKEWANSRYAQNKFAFSSYVIRAQDSNDEGEFSIKNLDSMEILVTENNLSAKSSGRANDHSGEFDKDEKKGSSEVNFFRLDGSAGSFRDTNMDVSSRNSADGGTAEQTAKVLERLNEKSKE
ncbi:hypothetical protein KY321_03355, partial [Candidatus Woesearchaeota archaeon]|nr:hypothetical protein [Candidatus Woesearchaeota archaeon]